MGFEVNLMISLKICLCSVCVVSSFILDLLKEDKTLHYKRPKNENSH